MRNGFRRALSWCSICAVVGAATQARAINFELAASPANQKLGVVAYADVSTPGTGLIDARLGFEALPAVARDAGSTSAGRAHSESEVGAFTDIQLNSPTAVISLLTPNSVLPPIVGIAPEVQEALGSSVPTGNSYSASLNALSVVNTFSRANPVPVDWLINVLPSPGEIAGTPTRVHISAIVDGLLSSAGNGTANASWQVLVNDTTQLQVGSAAAGAGASTPFADTKNHELIVPLGGAFELRFHWALSVSGNNLSTSSAKFNTARINLSAGFVPEPGSLALLAIGLVALAVRSRRRTPV